ncbi:hypothetical protein GH714_002549 [Hevea brasiliensis]|uniref:Inosine/uridine-preferring nucleoside hydrolase domain-containing protein n=1 Tax=Hevea brasiliensis TaxID=3981 RepID=A0A6A6KHU9_HEVBR|nr:hypothetical protein GH714_002549 [Hevea brasiliensis]
MDSAGDFLALFYLLKLPVEVINLKASDVSHFLSKIRCMAIIVSPTGWANAATIDVVYDLLHMMGRDDIPVGLGDVFAINQSDSIFSAVGDCKYVKAIPHGSGGFLDSDTLYGLARNLPRSPRRYTAENSAKFGAPRDTDHPELRQPLALEIWDSVVQKLEPGSKISILTNGPLTNLAKIILSRKNSSSVIQDTFLGEILGAVVLAGDPLLNPILQIKPIKVLAEGVESKDGQIVVDEKQGKLVKILESVDPVVYYDVFTMQLGVKNQSAVVGSFEEQRRMWSSQPNS